MRRLHIHHLRTGRFPLDSAEAHHARDVLRLEAGTEVELFDAAGQTAIAMIVAVSPQEVAVEVSSILPAARPRLTWTVAAAIPKGSRVDWMIEKLSELGCHRFVPVAAARSVVLPEGQGKRSRWQRLAEESAKQSHRAGVMEIAELTPLPKLLASLAAPAWYLSTAEGAVSARSAIGAAEDATELTLLIGPEGGWTLEEIGRFEAQGLTGVSLGRTILRVETAAIAASALVAAMLA